MADLSVCSSLSLWKCNRLPSSGLKPSGRNFMTECIVCQFFISFSKRVLHIEQNWSSSRVWGLGLHWEQKSSKMSYIMKSSAIRLSFLKSRGDTVVFLKVRLLCLGEINAVLKVKRHIKESETKPICLSTM